MLKNDFKLPFLSGRFCTTCLTDGVGIITEIMCLPAHGHVFTRCTLFIQDCLFLKEICTFWWALHNLGEQQLSKPELPILCPELATVERPVSFLMREQSGPRAHRQFHLCFLWMCFNSAWRLSYLTTGPPPCLGSVGALVTNQSLKAMLWLIMFAEYLECPSDHFQNGLCFSQV